MRKTINDFIDNKISPLLVRYSIWRWHIIALFFGLGLYLVILPLFHWIVVSANLELQLGNYTNVISAGVSLLTLAEAKRITDKQNIHSKKIDEIHKHLKINKKGIK